MCKRTRRHSFGMLGVCILSLACDTQETSGTGRVAEWRVDSLPAVSIGLSDSDNLDAAFERITGATLLPDGRILVADLGDAPLKLFDQDGTFLRRVTRKGQGPREITYLARLFRCGDLVYTYDIDGYRIQQWSLDGEYEREFRFVLPARQQAVYASACNAAGRFVHVGWGSRAVAPTAGYNRDTAVAWTSAAADSAPVVFDSVPSSERWGQTYEGEVVGSAPLPFGKQPFVAVGPSRIYIATGDPAGVLVYDLDGAPRPAVPLADSAPPVTPDDVRALIEREVLQDGESRRRAIEREYADITFPDTKSNVTALLVDAEERLWVRPPARANAATVLWQVFDPDGGVLATISLPSALEVFEIGADYILGRQLDETAEVPLVQLFRFSRGD